MKRRPRSLVIVASALLIALLAVAAVVGVGRWLDSDPVTVKVAMLKIDGRVIDLGDTPARFMDAPPNAIGNGYLADGDFVYLPLTATLRALGFDVDEVVDGEARITGAGGTYILSIADQTLVREDGTGMDALLSPPGGFAHFEVVGNELMVDDNTLFATTLPILDGSFPQKRWICRPNRLTGVVSVVRQEGA